MSDIDEIDIIDALIDERDWYDDKLTTVEAENVELKKRIEELEHGDARNDT